MKPENILQATFLDILFDERNKTYGAYTLRKSYNSRLLKSFAVTILFSLSLAVGHYIHAHYLTAKDPIVHRLPVHEFEIIRPAEEQNKKENEKDPKKAPKQVSQKAYLVPEIVKDNLADKYLPEVKEFDFKSIGTLDKDGADANELVVPASEFGAQDNGETTEQPGAIADASAPLLEAEIMPQFPGGMEAFKKFMLRHLRQPELGEGEKIVVRVQFLVEADGSIKNVHVVHTGGALDDEVIRVVGKMPKWKPGVQNGRFVAVYFTLPVTFIGPEM